LTCSTCDVADVEILAQWIVLCLTKSFNAFVAISFICGATTVTPQLMLPLVGDLAPAKRRGTALSVVVSGLVLGMLVARVLSGVIANYTDWRNIYWFGFAVQWVIFGLLFAFMPDYPSKNPGGLNYFAMLWSIVHMLFTEPLLVQACLISFSISAVFTSYWTTLSFLLSSPPYSYSSVDIGLFGLIGIAVVTLGPVYSLFIIDKMVPLLSTLLGLVTEIAGVATGTFIGNFTIAGPIIQAITIDVGNQFAQIANRASIYTIQPKARNRVNTAYMLSAFIGQLTGTAVGNRLYAEGGWRYSGACSSGSSP
jgi:predicted MFS family arabinose efflux permease